MSSVQVAPLPPGAHLERYRESGAYTDCYTVAFPGRASLSEYMAAFYTTPVFKLERRLLALFLRFPSTDQEARQLAQGQTNRFSAWHVESRDTDQAILAAGRTRSWLMVSRQAASSEATHLFFGSAVVPRKRGGLGWQFTALLGFHKLYSRILLASAVRRLSRAHKT